MSLVAANQIVAQEPPYSGTIFIEPKIVTSDDPSVFESCTYKGQATRDNIFDRRTNRFETIKNAFVYEIVWSDGLTTEAVINPEFETKEAAEAEACKYGFIVGQLPYVLRTDVDQIWIHKGNCDFGGGNRSLLIHTGRTVEYERDGILEETLIHEATHTSLDSYHYGQEWSKARAGDGKFISTYAKDNPDSEDISESFLLWLAVRYFKDRILIQNYNTIVTTIPNRLVYFDKQNFNLAPLVTRPKVIE